MAHNLYYLTLVACSDNVMHHVAAIVFRSLVEPLRAIGAWTDSSFAQKNILGGRDVVKSVWECAHSGGNHLPSRNARLRGQVIQVA